MKLGQKYPGFTLLEIVVVIVIIGIIAALGVANYTRIKEEALDNEARSMLKLIKSAERTYHLEANTYIGSTNTTQTNDRLGLELPTGSESNWGYTVPTADSSSFCAQAERLLPETDPNYRHFHINETQDEVQEGGCP